MCRFLVCLPSFGVVLRFSCCHGLLFLCGCSTAGHDIFEFVVEVSCCCVGGRRVGLGRIEGLFLVCLVSVHRALVPFEFVVTASDLFLAAFLAGRSIC